MDEAGKDSKRARNLKYAVKINRYFLNAIKAGKDIHLFDPKDVPELTELYGKEFDRKYEWAKDNINSKQIIPARDLAYLIAKERVETGNLYIFFPENTNENSPFKDTIYSSNICMEIALPTSASKKITTDLVESFSTKEVTHSDNWTTGLTALCNLSSLNVVKWMETSTEEKHQIAKDLLEASDNLIDYQYYPTPDGELFNKNYRAIGIGMINLAYYFAKQNIKYSSNEAKEHMLTISKSIKSVFTEESKHLAQKRGNFPWFNRTNLTTPSRFATLFALAPSSTNSLIIGASEGAEPVTALLKEKTGTYSSKQLVPELQKYGNNYELAFDIPTKALYDLAAIRQKNLYDQSQSVNTYMAEVTSAKQVWDDIIYAESVGMCTLYYLQSKTSSTVTCESCEA